MQLASLSSRESAEKLQKTLRSQGYNAYIRTADGKNRVFVGPLIERAEADRLRDLLNRQQNLKGFVVRFQPERGKNYRPDMKCTGNSSLPISTGSAKMRRLIRL